MAALVFLFFCAQPMALMAVGFGALMLWCAERLHRALRSGFAG